jgi:hypothetical protein
MLTLLQLWLLGFAQNIGLRTATDNLAIVIRTETSRRSFSTDALLLHAR